MTVKEIAKLANVSPATVSNVLNHRNNVGEETRQRILETVSYTHLDVYKRQVSDRNCIRIKRISSVSCCFSYWRH